MAEKGLHIPTRVFTTVTMSPDHCAVVIKAFALVRSKGPSLVLHGVVWSAVGISFHVSFMPFLIASSSRTPTWILLLWNSALSLWTSLHRM